MYPKVFKCIQMTSNVFKISNVYSQQCLHSTNVSLNSFCYQVTPPGKSVSLLNTIQCNTMQCKSSLEYHHSKVVKCNSSKTPALTLCCQAKLSTVYSTSQSCRCQSQIGQNVAKLQSAEPPFCCWATNPPLIRLFPNVPKMLTKMFLKIFVPKMFPKYSQNICSLNCSQNCFQKCS